MQNLSSVTKSTDIYKALTLTSAQTPDTTDADAQRLSQALAAISAPSSAAALAVGGVDPSKGAFSLVGSAVAVA